MEQLRQYYWGIEEDQFVDRGYNLTYQGGVEYSGEEYSDGRLTNFYLHFLRQMYGGEIIYCQSLAGVEISRMFDSIRKTTTNFLAPALSKEEKRLLVEGTQGTKIVVYSVPAVNRNDPKNEFGVFPEQPFNENNKLAHIQMKKDTPPIIFLDLKHLEQISRGVSEGTMRLRQDGHVITDDDARKIVNHFIQKDVTRSLTHELLHWVLFTIRNIPAGEQDRFEEEIEKYTELVVKISDKEETELPTKWQLQAFLGKVLF